MISPADQVIPAKRPPWRTVLLVLVVALAMAVYIRGLMEPSYRGKGISEWTDALGTEDFKQAESALRNIGVNVSARHLVRVVGWKETAFGRRYRDFYPKLPAMLRTRLPKPVDLEHAAFMRDKAAEALANVFGPEARMVLPQLSALIQSDNDDIRFSAACALQGMEQAAEPAIPEIIKALKEGNKECYVLLNTLAQLGDKATPAVPAIEKLLIATNARARFGAARALVKIDPSRADALRPRLIAALDGEEAGIRIEAATSLWELDHQAEVIVPTLIALLDDKGHPFGFRAILLLGKIGPGAKSAAPAVRGMLTDRLVGDAAAKTLTRIDSEGASNESKDFQAEGIKQ